MQWIFEKPRNAYAVIRAIGARSLTGVILRDYNFRIIESYTSMVQYPYGLADEETIKWIKKKIAKNPGLRIELVRK